MSIIFSTETSNCTYSFGVKNCNRRDVKISEYAILNIESLWSLDKKIILRVAYWKQAYSPIIPSGSFSATFKSIAFNNFPDLYSLSILSSPNRIKLSFISIR